MVVPTGVATDSAARFFPPDEGVFLTDDFGVLGLWVDIQCSGDISRKHETMYFTS